jgi:integrase
MVADGKLSAKTINEKRIALIRALLGWGLDKSNRKITGENVASGIRVEDDKRKERSKSFRLEEARAILKASFAIEVDAQASRGTAMLPGKRWAPWICCYTGARIVEVTQLRRQDVRKVDGIWVLEITPEAGNTKSDTARIVPVHSDLISQGFIRYVESRPAGPLFYDPSRGRSHADGRGKKRSLPESVANKLAHWVRHDVGITDRRIRPNHAWRHWFVNQCRLHGVDKEARYFMAGHVESDGRSDVGNSYGDALVPFLKRELEKIPAFDLKGSTPIREALSTVNGEGQCP